MISVIICTYNRSASLRQTLQSLAALTVPAELAWELIVVDNNSCDNTKNIVAEFTQASGLRVRYVLEAEQGLTRARNRGVSEARGEIIAFTDDDCIVAPNWIETIAAEFGREADLAVLCGSFFNYNKQQDRTIRHRIFKERTVFSAAKHTFKLIVGGNMAFRRCVFEKVGKFDPHLDVGTKFKSAGDSDFVYRAFKAGFKIIHAPQVIVHHNHGRRTGTQVLNLKRGYVLGHGAFYGKHILLGDREVLQLAKREMVKRIKQIVKTIIAGEPVLPSTLLLLALIQGTVSKCLSYHRESKPA